MTLLIQTKTPMEAWNKVMKTISSQGTITSLKDGRKRIFMHNVIVEVSQGEKSEELIELLESQEHWIYPSKEELLSLIMDKSTRNYEYSYGQKIFDYNGINQVDNFVIPVLKKKPISTQAIINLWNPEIEGKMGVKGKISLHSIFFNVVDEKLNMTIVVRSNDFTLGWPANLYQTYKLQEYVADKVGIKIGTITTFSPNGHIYPENFNYIKRELLPD